MRFMHLNLDFFPQNLKTANNVCLLLLGAIMKHFRSLLQRYKYTT